MIRIRPFTHGDAEGLWSVLESTIRSGETYALPRDMSARDAVAYWTREDRTAFVAVDDDELLAGTYYLRANAMGGGAHVANCGYVVAQDRGGRGIARTMCAHSLDEARRRGFKAMQFNLVVVTNVRAVALWETFGFERAGCPWLSTIRASASSTRSSCIGSSNRGYARVRRVSLAPLSVQASARKASRPR